jgi:quinol monooxygenase YgiN
MAYVVNLVLTAKPEEFEDLVAYMVEILPDTAKYEGAQVITCYSDPATHMLTVHEIWDSKAHQQAYFQWRAETGVVDRIVGMVAGPPAFEEYTHVAF